tara:strand:+ start:1855 stop:2430 length:576 start_codon:yes stop_codon:yes gene_type:complete
MLHARTDIIDRVVAVVGSDVIMLSDVRTVTTFGLIPDARNEADVLTRLIDRALILAEVNRFIVPEPGVGVIEAKFDDLRSSFPTPEAFLHALAEVGMTETGLARVLLKGWRVENYLEQRFGSMVQPTETELAQYYRGQINHYSVSGERQPFDQIRDQVRRDLQEERQGVLIADWITRLSLRVKVTRLDEEG